MVLDDDGRARLDNTDLPGAVGRRARALATATCRPATVLGAGATAASAGLRCATSARGTVRLLARSPERAAETAAVIARAPRRRRR